MIKIIVTVALYNSQKRLPFLIDSFNRLENLDEILFVFVNTSEEDEDQETYISFSLSNVVYKQSIPGSRYYSDVMHEKMRIVKEYAKPGMLIHNCDDDYFLNPHCYKFFIRIFEENQQVQYMSLVNCPLHESTPKEELSGFPFFLTGSTMGGAVCARSDHFIPDVMEYLSLKDRDLMWDRGFYTFMKEKRGYDVYMPALWSLARHQNFGSNFLNMKRDENEHVAGENFIMFDPFEFRR